MTAGTASCLRCGGTNLVPAHLQHTSAFCVDHTAHHGVLHVGLKASLCQDCGHVEFWVPDPHILAAPPQKRDVVLQEEDF